MKKIFSIIFLIPILSFAQQKKDNAIVIHEAIAIEKIKSVLFSSGYLINNSDLGFISTDARELSVFNLKIGVLRTDSTVTIKGWIQYLATIQFAGTKAQDTYTLLYYAGVNGSYYKTAWNELDKIAKLLSEKIEYVKQ